TALSPSVHMSGPPESPWHASTPPLSRSPAQSIESAWNDEPYAPAHSSSETCGTSTNRSSFGASPSSSTPQPATSKAPQSTGSAAASVIGSASGTGSASLISAQSWASVASSKASATWMSATA